MRLSLCLSALAVSLTSLCAQGPPYLLTSPNIQSKRVQAWQKAKISAVAPRTEQHSIHGYFNTSPESPDGRYVTYYTSTTPEGEKGEIRVLERATGKERTLVTGINTEDAHRVACQQWIAGGRKIAFHDFRDGQWVVVVVDVESGEQKVLAKERQIGIGEPMGMWAPIYGYHWKQGAHRDLELVNVETGEIKTVVTIKEVLEKYSNEVRKLVGEGEVSIFFPVLSFDASKVMFKVSRGSGTDDFRSKAASTRDGKFVYDLVNKKFLGLYEQWGHPSWSPDSTGILEKGIVVQDLASKTVRRYAVGSPSDHQGLSPDSKLYVADAQISKRETGKPNEWGIIVGSLETNEFATIHRFEHVNGATSWRSPHPHPVFSADGKRIYFNASKDGWTRLYVAQVGDVVE